MTGERGALAEYLLRLGDDRLVLGHRLSEWCGHGPVLEEDIATANIALDLLGQATIFLRMAGQAEGAGRDEDALQILEYAIRKPGVKRVTVKRPVKAPALLKTATTIEGKLVRFDLYQGANP